MMFSKFASQQKKRLMSSLVAAGCLLTGIPAISWAQSNSGLVLFSGVNNRADILSYYLDFGGNPGMRGERYRLRIPAKKMELGVIEFAIKYPDYFDGEFDTDRIEVRIDGQAQPLSEVIWNKEDHLIQIYLEETLEAGQSVELVFSNTENPDSGVYYFQCLALSAGDVPLPRYLGTWIISIGR